MMQLLKRIAQAFHSEDDANAFEVELGLVRPVEPDVMMRVVYHYAPGRPAPFASHPDSPGWSDPGDPDEFEILAATEAKSGKPVLLSREEEKRLETYFDDVVLPHLQSENRS